MNISSTKIKLSLFLRRPRPGENYSIERLFDAVVAALPADRYEVQRQVCPFESKGLIRRLALIIWAALRQGDVNHITGDVNFLGLLMRRSRTLLTILDSASIQRLTGWRRWIYRVFWLRLPIWRAGRVTVISEATLHETLSHVHADPAKFVVIRCCVPHGLSAQPRSFSDKRPSFLVVGTGSNKNLHRIIEALAGLPCRLVIIGELSGSHRKLIADHGLNVTNHARLDDAAVALQYRESDAVLFVPTYEGFGLPILEAQAVGRPLITSRRPPMQEVAGAGGCLVNPEAVTEIREAVLRITSDLEYRAALVQAGFENVRGYSAEAVAAHYALVYEELFSGPAKSVNS
jgi:glycosyltransferase involved in cell wall biosynthesis